MVREIYHTELDELLNLYLNLHEDTVPEMTDYLKTTWETIVNDDNHHIVVNEMEELERARKEVQLGTGEKPITQKAFKVV